MDRLRIGVLFGGRSEEHPISVKSAREVARVLKPDGRFLVADWGAPSDPLMRGLFVTIQLVDGFQTTADNVAGRLPELLRAGFAEVAERDRYRTATGSLVLLEALAPR